MKETLIGQMTAINSENSCLMMEHMKSIYQIDNVVQIEHMYKYTQAVPIVQHN